MPEKYKRRRETAAGFKLSIVGFLSNLVSKTNLWLALTISFLILVVLGYLGLWSYKDSLIIEKGNLEREIEGLTNQRNLETETNFIEIKDGIDDLKKILENLFYPSELFEMLEEIALPQVQFTDLNVDLSQTGLSLDIEAIDYLTLAKQIVAFEQDLRIKKVELSDVELDISGRIGSNLEIELDADFLRGFSEFSSP